MTYEAFDLWAWQRVHPNPGDYFYWARRWAHEQGYIDVTADKRELLDTVAEKVIAEKGYSRAADLLGVSDDVLAAWRAGKVWTSTSCDMWVDAHREAVQLWQEQQAQAVLEWYGIQMEVAVPLDVTLGPLVAFSLTSITDSDGDSITDECLGFVAIAILQTYVATCAYHVVSRIYPEGRNA